MLVISHRGTCPSAPENTLAAFEAVIAAGVDGIETDLRASADGEVILFHDRLSPEDQEVSSLTREALSRQVGYKVPTLQAALDQFPSVQWMLEIKSPDAAQPAMEILRDRAAERNLLITSFWHPVIDQLPGDLPMQRGVVYSHRPVRLAAVSGENLPAGVGVLVWNYEFMDETLLHETASAGFRNFVYGLSSVAEHRRCAAADVTGAITDHPEYLLSAPRA